MNSLHIAIPSLEKEVPKEDKLSTPQPPDTSTSDPSPMVTNSEIIPTTPTINLKQQQFTNRSAPLIAKVRQNVSKAYQDKPDVFDVNDIRRVEADDWFVKKFLLVCDRNPKSASAMLIDTLKWRKCQGIYETKLTDFPSDLYRLGSFFIYQTDKLGHPIIYVRPKHFRRHKLLRPELVKFGISVGTRLEAQTPNGIVSVIDFRGMSISNVDLEIMRIIISTIMNHFPLFIQKIYVVNLPSFLKMISTMLINIIPSRSRSNITFISQNELIKYIDEDKIPDFLGGKCTVPYKGDLVVPPGCPTFLEYALKIGWTLDQYSDVYHMVKSSFEDEHVDSPPCPPSTPPSTK
ncbi:motile sperm domain-containing protein 2-like [Brevipalpus obovatus]|uniref:motile sperm domain-containing protein 2-like n=1 Tax=Brevipalpus obovatus TaxID=246614 RepID=UPI003D9F366D